MTSRQLDEEAIFHIARDLTDPAKRAAYLDQICAGDQALRKRVEGLLDVHEKEQNFLKSNDAVDPTVDQSPINEAPGREIGRYKLLQEIGEGGFGVVFMAEQSRPIRRKVALKVIKPGMDTKAVVARFEAERQALAMMDHPNIAKVLDGGATDSGRPYFVMELVKGVPLTEYCDQNQLPTDERLALFVTVCQAVQHAHQKGIIHRDLKPSNILVTLHDGKPVIKVIDFGVAKAINQQLTEKTLFTAFGQMVGTPQYMSPEQAEISGLDVDTRSDVYSLGVLLYELLTGSTPLESEQLREAGYAEIQRLIKESEPMKPSTRLSTSGDKLTAVAKHRSTSPDRLSALIRGDLDWVVMKALEKDRNRRYATPVELGDDVNRYLSKETVEAHPPSTTYRMRKFLRRHRTLIVTAGVVVSALIAATAISTWSAWEMRLARNSAQQTLSAYREAAYKHGVSCIMNANEDEALTIIQQLRQDSGATDDLADRLEAILCLHNARFERAIEILEPAATKHPEDAGLRAMLTDAYDGKGEIDRFVESHLLLLELDTSSLSAIELVYAALANIAAPRHGYPHAERAVEMEPGSHYARLIRGRMAASYVMRCGGAGSRELSTVRESRLMDQALADIDSLRLLFDYDSRIPSQSLATYILVGNSRRANGEPNWQDYLEDAEEVVSFLDSRKKQGWENFFLAQYFYDAAEAGLDRNGRSKAMQAYEDAVLENDFHDYASNYYIAMQYELGGELNAEIKKAIYESEASVYGRRALGYWHALNGAQAEADELSDQLIEIGTDDAVVYAAEIQLMMGQRDDANEILSADAKSTGQWYRTEIRKFYRSQLDGNEDFSAAQLIASAANSDYPRLHLCFAYWAIGVWEFGRGEAGRKEAAEAFQLCEAQRQISFPQLVWSRALLKRVLSEESELQP